MSDFVDDAIARLREAGLLDEPRGCSDEEIARLEAARGLKLPAAYRRFLAAMGHGAGEFLRGTDWLFPDLPMLQEESEWLEANQLVFVSHQGVELMFFGCDGKDDPPVWLYDDDDETKRCVAVSFSKWLAGCVSDEIAAAKSLSDP